jgi:CBS domain-containing protein
MKVEDVMTLSPTFCTTQDPVFEAAKIMAQRDVGVVPICESMDTRRLIGCLTDRDIVVRVVAEGRNPSVPVVDVMTTHLFTVRPEDPIAHARELMEENQIRRLLVVDEYGSLMGVVSTADLARAVAEVEVGETLEAISQPAPTLNIK